jgi:hypothetical protein
MNARRPLPIGPLALVLRHVRPPASASRRIAILAVALTVALLVGIALLLR